MGFSEYFKTNYKRILKGYVFIILGSIILAIGSAFFLIPAKINAGGLSGLSIVANTLWGFDEDIVVLILTWLFFILSLIFLGKKFTFKSLIATLVYPLAVIAISRIPYLTNLANDTFVTVAGTSDATARTLIAGVFGGSFVGIGVALTFMGGGSTGGVDILMFIIHRFTKIKESILTFAIDASIIVIGLFVLDNFLGTLIGIISAFICAVTIEYVFVGKSSSLTAHIISKEKMEEINGYIHNVMLRGSTILNVEGGYQREKYQMLIVSFNRKEYAALINAVARIDKKAFVTVSSASDVIGEGFSQLPEIKHKGKK